MFEKRYLHIALIIILGVSFFIPIAVLAKPSNNHGDLLIRESRITTELEVLVVPNVSHSWQAVNLENSYSNPIPVCTYALPSAASNPAAVRIRNITATSFEVRVQEPLNSSAVTASDIHCIVAEEGYHTLSDGRIFEAHSVVSSNTSGSNAQGWGGTGEDVSGDIIGTYANPVVLGQVISNNNDDFSAFWSYDCDNRANPPFASGMSDGICVGKHIGEVSIGSLVLTRNTENIGYIVIEGDLDGVGGNDPVGTLTSGVSYEVALGADTVDGVDNNGTAYTLNNSGYSLGVASQSAMDGNNGGWAVLYGNNPLAGNQVDLAIDEDTLGDTERSHTAENVAYWVFESDPGLPWMEVRAIANVGSTWQTVTLNNDYSSMVPVCTYNLPSSSDNEAVVRIQNIDNGADRFEIRIQRPRDSTSVTASDVNCVVIEEGSHTLQDQNPANDRTIEAHITTSTQFNENNNWGNTRMENVGYSNSYNQPVVLGQVITYNDANFSVFWSSNGTATNPPDASNLYVGKHVGEDPGQGAWSDETLGYIVAEAGSGFSDGYFYELALGADTIAGVGDSPPYSYTLADTYTYGVATKEAEDGGHGGWAVLYGNNPLAGNQIDLAIEEETYAGDTTRTHTTEQVAYWVFAPTIGGTIWEDPDVDGNLEGGEPRFNNATVWLCPDTHPMPPAGPACYSATTDINGDYYFRNITTGNYYIAVADPNPTYSSTSGGNHDPSLNDQIDDGLPYSGGGFVISQDFSYTSGAGSSSFDFGYAIIAEIGDYVWEDDNGDGIQNAGETGLDNVLVELFNNLGVSQGTTTTAADGSYLFSPLPVGDYYLTFTPPIGYILSPANQGSDDTADSDPDRTSRTTNSFSLAAGTTDRSWDAGMYPQNAHIFDPPSGYKNANANGWPILVWRQVWINNSNTGPVAAQVVDPIPANTTYINASLTCDEQGASTTTTCVYDTVNDRILWEGTIAADPGALNENDANNEVVISFSTTVTGNVDSVANQGLAFWDENGDGALDNNDVNIATNDPARTDDLATAPANDPTVARPLSDIDTLPATGFPPGIKTKLLTQPASDTHQTYKGLWIEIPSLRIKLPITGVPRTGSGWDVTWLGNRAGYLHETAFPTWAGNTAITAHVWNSDNTPGPFAQLKSLRYGDRVIIHAWGINHVYEVRSVEIVSPKAIQVLAHSDYDTITLLTCSNYDENLKAYKQRVVAQAVLKAVHSGR